MSTCYFWNGTAAPPELTLVCNPKAGSAGSMCCDKEHNDVCTPEGLCYQGSFNAAVQYWRGTCTDPTWTAPACIRQCPWYANDTPPMQRCSDGTWCCDGITGTGYTINNSCCFNSEGARLQPSTALFTLPATSSATSLATSSVTSTTSASAHPGNGPSNDNTSLKVGLGVGLGLGIPLVAGLVLLALFSARLSRRLRAYENSRRAEVLPEAKTVDMASYPSNYGNMPGNLVEVPAHTSYPAHELEGQRAQLSEL